MNRGIRSNASTSNSGFAREAILARGGKPVIRFSPSGDPEPKNLGLEHYFGMDAKRCLWQLEALGPLIEVYSMH